MRRLIACALWLLTAALPVAAGSEGLPFLHDDYARALTEAKQRHVPMFVEVSAPW
ncbi:MAG TPA: hypothetical protein VGF76_01415 [Polyangiaceae bacterium]